MIENLMEVASVAFLLVLRVAVPIALTWGLSNLLRRLAPTAP